MWEIVVLTKFIVSDSFCILLGRSTDPRESATFHAEYIVVLVLTWSGSPTQLLLENFPSKMGTMSGFDPILNPPHGQKVLKDSLHMNVLRNLHERTQAKMYKFIWPTHTWYLLREPQVYPCKFFLAGVNFYRFKIGIFKRFYAKKWRFFTDSTRKIGVFWCKFYSPKILLV